MCWMIFRCNEMSDMLPLEFDCLAFFLLTHSLFSSWIWSTFLVFLKEPNKYLTTISIVVFWLNIAPWHWTWFPWSTARDSSLPCRSSDLSLFSLTKLHYRPCYNSFTCVQIHNHKPHYHIIVKYHNLKKG